MIGDRYFSDLALSRRLERAEGLANATFVTERASLDPGSGAAFTQVGNTLVMYDGPGSPLTQAFCLGLFEPASDEILDAIEAFYSARGVQVDCEVSPLAGIGVYSRLHERGYRPVELSTVLFQPLEPAAAAIPSQPAETSEAVTTREMAPGEEDLWAETCAAGWLDAAPGLTDFLLGIGRVNTHRADTTCFLGEIDGVPVAAAALTINEGVALLAGASTKLEARGRGAQRALLQARLEYARRTGCDLAMIGALPGSRSQRNAERAGFLVAYTRTKWQRTP